MSWAGRTETGQKLDAVLARVRMSATRESEHKSQTRVFSCPEAALMFAVFDLAIKDAFGVSGSRVEQSEQRQAIMYLRGDMPHAQMLGVDPEWVRKLLREVFKECDDLFRIESAGEFYRRWMRFIEKTPKRRVRRSRAKRVEAACA